MTKKRFAGIVFAAIAATLLAVSATASESVGAAGQVQTETQTKRSGIEIGKDGKIRGRAADGSEIRNGWGTFEGKRYYFGKDGRAYAGVVSRIGKKLYGFSAKGVAYENSWATFGGNRYYFGKNGIAYENEAKRIDGKLYGFSAKGIMMKSRWATFAKNRYYFGKNGAAYENAARRIDGKTYGFSPKGVSYLNRWATFGGKKYYFGGKRYALTGWRKIGGSEYYFNAYGVMQKNKWVGGKWLTASGKYDPKKKSLKTKIQEKTRTFPGTWSVYVKNLKTGETTEVNSGRRTYAASLIKLYVLGATLDRIKTGKLSSNQWIEKSMTNMITVSDNWSCNYLIKTTGKSVVNSWISRNGYSGTKVVHGLSPASNNDGIRTGPGQNETTAKDCGKFLEAVYRGTLVDKNVSKKALGLLKRQTRRSKIPAGVPSGTTVANKTGETNNTSHDAAIVYAPKCDYVLVVMSDTNGLGWSQPTNIAKISRLVYEHYNK